jgi:hypothetical protein
MNGPVDATAGVSNVVQTATFTLESPDPALPLQPGDSYTFGIFRQGGGGSDTCASTALIDSMVVLYE